MREYADSSFLVSFYVPDANHAAASAHARHWTQPPQLPLTPFGAFELNNTLRRLVFLGSLNQDDLRRLIKCIREDAANDILQELPLEAYRLIHEANEVSSRVTPLKGTRALDILHIAAARLHRAKVFLSFDKNQRLAAQTCGLQVKP